MAKLTNKQINFELIFLRDEIRQGNIIVFNGDLRTLVGQVISADETPIEFTTENFNPQTLTRFDTLFAVPETATRDQVATAIQNFINRRKDPWAHMKAKPTPMQAISDGQFV